MASDTEDMRGALSTVLASLVAAVSVLERSSDEGKAANLIVASNSMFRQMLKDYRAAIQTGRDATALRALPIPLSDAPASPWPKVKALEWTKRRENDTLTSAETVIGRYRVWTFHEAKGRWFADLRDGSGLSSWRAEGTSEAEMHAAAQANYESRILSALEGTPTPPAEPATSPTDTGAGEPRGCPTPGACSAATRIADLEWRLAASEATESHLRADCRKFATQAEAAETERDAARTSLEAMERRVGELEGAVEAKARRVKSMKWCARGDDWTADVVVGRYEVGRVGPGHVAILRHIRKGQMRDTDILRVAGTEEEAMAAAEADYESRIAAALTPDAGAGK